MNKLYASLSVLTLLLPLAQARAGEEKCAEDAATCAQQMAEHYRQRGWVGINMDYDEERGQVAVTKVIPGSPAEKAGLQEGDILRALNGVAYSTENKEVLKKEHESFRPGGTAKFTVQRGAELVDIEVKLEKIPEAVLAQWVGYHVLEYHSAEAETEQDQEAEKSP